MSKLLRRLLPLAAVYAWRNRTRISEWYQDRQGPNDPPAAPNDRPPASTGGAPHS